MKPTFSWDLLEILTLVNRLGDGRGGDSLVMVGTDVRARALGISGVNFCAGIRFSEVNFAGALGFWQFLTKKMCNN